MMPASGDGQNKSEPLQWPSVLKITGSEFEQSVAVACLAVKLFECKKANLKISPLEKKNLAPEKFLAEAWGLIEKARAHVLRSQTEAEYLATRGGSCEAAEMVIGRKRARSRVPFRVLCNENGGTKLIHGVHWKVCATERAFENLFWTYWNDLGEQWMQWKKGEKARPAWMKTDGVTFAKLAHNKEKYPGGFEQLWKERGQSVLDSWKGDGVPPNDFLALASGYFDFEHGVRFITGENRIDRALPWFRRFLKSRFPDEGTAERAMAKYREERFASEEPYSLKDEFAKWKRTENSRNAKLSREARGKRGRVRSKSDKRLGPRYKGKRILSSKEI